MYFARNLFDKMMLCKTAPKMSSFESEILTCIGKQLDFNAVHKPKDFQRKQTVNTQIQPYFDPSVAVSPVPRIGSL